MSRSTLSASHSEEGPIIHPVSPPVPELAGEVEINLLADLSAAVTTEHGPAAVLRGMTDILSRHVGLRAGACYLGEDDSEELALATSWGGAEPWPESLTPDGAAGGPDHLGGNREVDSSWCVPLLSQGQLQGVLLLSDVVGPASGPFSGAFRRMLGQLLGTAISNARLLEQIRAGRERLRVLSNRLVEVQEAERRHLALELHDEVGQMLTGLKFMLDTGESTEPIQPQRLQHARDMVNELIGHIREISLDLRPAMLDDFGILSALLWLFDRFTTRTGIQVQITHAGVDGVRFSTGVETTAYRIIQEALTNVARHSGASEATVRLWADDGKLNIQVEDRGIGFDPDQLPGGGPASIRERVVLAGGLVSVDAALGAGVRLFVELPCEDTARPGRLIERRQRRR